MEISSEFFRIAAVEMQTMMEIDYILSVAREDSGELDEVFLRLSQLVPFQKCVLFHESLSNAKDFCKSWVFSRVSTNSQPVRVAQFGDTCIDSYMKEVWWHGMSEHVFPIYRVARNFDGTRHEIASSVQLLGSESRLVIVIKGADDGGRALIHLEADDHFFSERQSIYAVQASLRLYEYFVRCVQADNVMSYVHLLTEKEMDVMAWVVAGKTSWEVGKILTISERTVKFHLKNIYMKLNVVNRAQAVAKTRNFISPS